MVARITTVAFEGINVIPIDVQVQITAGMPAFTIVGLPDKAVAESRERVRSALHALGLALPSKRITVNLSPADIQKEGSHYDLPIALGLLVGMGVIPADAVEHTTALGELALDGAICSVSGILPAAIDALRRGESFICPAGCGPEAAWAQGLKILAPPSLIALMGHFKGSQVLKSPQPKSTELDDFSLDLVDVKGQETAKRALEITAAGGHNLLMSGPPGSGKSMLAARLPGLLPALSPEEALEVTMIHSIAGELSSGTLIKKRPFRDPHHSATLPALVGGGFRAKPGEISLAHHGVLFLDELPEFARATLESLRQPLETGRAVIARANTHITYPARVQLIAAMNPCRCGHLADPEVACSRAPKCAADYQSKISGPLLDRFDLHVDVPAVSAMDLALPRPRETSADIAVRVAHARKVQLERFQPFNEKLKIRTNAQADGTLLQQIATPDAEGRKLLERAVEIFKLSARGYHRILRVARTLADLESSEKVGASHISEALSFRKQALAA